MAYSIKFQKRAEKDLNEICEYKARFYPGTPGKFLAELLDNIAENPKICPEYEYDDRYRKLVADNHLVFYKILENQKIVKICRILHGKRDIQAIIPSL